MMYRRKQIHHHNSDNGIRVRILIHRMEEEEFLFCPYGISRFVLTLSCWPHRDKQRGCILKCLPATVYEQSDGSFKSTFYWCLCLVLAFGTVYLYSYALGWPPPWSIKSLRNIYNQPLYRQVNLYYNGQSHMCWEVDENWDFMLIYF